MIETKNRVWIPPLGKAMDQTGYRNSLTVLDILMVCHSFMLSPVAYNATLPVDGRRPNSLGRPVWDQLVRSCKIDTSYHRPQPSLIRALIRAKAIDQETWRFHLPPAQINQVSRLGLDVDLLEAIIEKTAQSGEPDSSSTRIMEWMNSEKRRLMRHLRLRTEYDLVDAVHRQSNFAAKMVKYGWAHSPNRISFLTRAIGRYKDFVSLIAEANKSRCLVPTIDILVWHTHQLSPAAYSSFTRAATQGHLINHSDTVPSSSLRAGFADTQRIYLDSFGRQYSVCNSWNCRAESKQQLPELLSVEVIKARISEQNQKRLRLGLGVMKPVECCCCVGDGAVDVDSGVEMEPVLSCGGGSSCEGSGCVLACTMECL